MSRKPFPFNGLWPCPATRKDDGVGDFAGNPNFPVLATGAMRLFLIIVAVRRHALSLISSHRRRFGLIAAQRYPLEDRPSGRDDQDRRAAFARVFAQNDRWLYAYLMTLLGNPAHAEEVFQEACVVLWREYESFDLSTNFRRWAGVVALNQVRRFRRNLRRKEVWLSEAVVERLAEEAIEQADELEGRRRALHVCMERLAPGDRDLVRLCYSGSGSSIKEAAAALGRPANTAYKAMARIRRVLHDCITRRLAAEGAP